MIIDKYRVTLENGYEEYKTEDEALVAHPDKTSEFIQEEILLPEPDLLKAREDALAIEWPDPFTLLDDILNEGVAPLTKARRDAIKAAHPKPT